MKTEGHVSKVRTDPVAAALGVASRIKKVSGSNSTFRRARTTVQIWTVEEGFGIGSEFRQTCCAASNFRVHQVFLHWFNSSSPKWNLKIDGRPCQSEALSRGEPASVPLIRYWLTFPGEDSLELALHETTRL